MKHLLSKEHYCSKIPTLLIKEKELPFYRQSPTWINPHFHKENLYPPFLVWTLRLWLDSKYAS